MRRLPEGEPRGRWPIVTLARTSIASLYEHWALSGFSLVAAFAIWFVIEDVENPRVQGDFPPASEPASIPVEAQNTGDYIAKEITAVRVRVEARKGQIQTLIGDDFVATVDASAVTPGESVELPVHVRSKRDGVRVVSVDPPKVQVTVLAAEEREFPVTLRRTSALTPGYREADEPAIDPPVVKVRGLPELVESVNSVDVDVNLSGVRDDQTIPGDLVAHTASGNEVTVTLSQTRAKVSFKIEQVFVQRSVAVLAQVTGTPALGFRVTSITVNPATVPLAGPESIMKDIQSLTTDAVDVTGAKSDVVINRNIQAPQNTTIDQRTASVMVEIKPIEGSTLFKVDPVFTNRPPGLVTDLGEYSVEVKVNGPLAALALLKPADIRVTVSLAGALAGTATYPVTVTVPAGLRFDTVAPLTVTLKPGVGP
jgi:YbbR domain-containing protein